MTSFTVVAKTSFTPGVRVSGWEAGNDVLERGGCGRPTNAVRSSSGQRPRVHDGALPGVHDFSAHRLTLASALSGRAPFIGSARAQPPPTPQPPAHPSPDGPTRHRTLGAYGLGSDEAASTAGGVTD